MGRGSGLGKRGGDSRAVACMPHFGADSMVLPCHILDPSAGWGGGRPAPEKKGVVNKLEGL